MPIVTVTTTGKKPLAFKDAVFGAIQDALAEVGVPRENRFHRFLELAPEDFRFGETFPEARRPRTADFVLIEIMWSVGRTVVAKKVALEKLSASLQAAGLDPENAMVCFSETAWENWACAGGRLGYA